MPNIFIIMADDTIFPVYEISDYEKDPLETRNIANERPNIVASLKEILERHPEALIDPDLKE